MKAKDFMHENPTCCTPETSLMTVAQKMVECDCGCIPVVDSLESRRLLGMITDRDITVRAVARGINPLELTARDCMTPESVTVRPSASLGEVCDLMESKQIRRVAVVGDDGCLCGIIAQADVAEHASKRLAGEVVRKVSQNDHANGHTTSFTTSSSAGHFFH